MKLIVEEPDYLIDSSYCIYMLDEKGFCTQNVLLKFGAAVNHQTLKTLYLGKLGILHYLFQNKKSFTSQFVLLYSNRQI